jgi:hypothetical protein
MVFFPLIDVYTPVADVMFNGPRKISDCGVKLPVQFTNKNCMFKVLNELGQQVLVGHLSSTENEVDFSGQSSGLYLLKINIDRNTITRKIVFDPGRQ